MCERVVAVVGGVFGRRAEADGVAVRAAVVDICTHGADKVAQAVIL